MTNQQAPEALADPSPDQLRAIARTARNSSGSASDDCGPLAYVLHGWRAAAIAFRAQQAALVDAQQPAPSAAGEPHGVLAWPKPGPENPTWTICPKFLEKIMRSSASEYMPGLEEIEAVLLGLRTLFSAGRVALPGWESEYGEKCPKCHGIGYYDEGHEYDDGTMGSGNYVDCEKCKPSPTPQADSQPAVQQWNDLIGKETHADADGLLVWRDEADFAIPKPQADSQPTPVQDYPPLPEYQGKIFDDGYWIQNKLGPKHYVMGGAKVWLESQVHEAIDADRAARAPADSVTAPVLGTIAHVGTGKTTLTGAITSALRAARAPADSVTAPATDSYVQPVPDKCDRIVWRGHYYHLPPTAQAADSVTAPAGEVVGYRISDPGEPDLGHWLSEEPGAAWCVSEPLALATHTQPAHATKAGNQQEARPCHVFTVRKAGGLTEWEPTSMAFALPDGAHALYTLPQPTPPAQAADSVLEDAARESEYRRGYRHGYEQRDAEVRGALA